MVSPSLMLDEAEYSEFCNEINKVLEKYSGKPYNKKRKVRNMYFYLHQMKVGRKSNENSIISN